MIRILFLDNINKVRIVSTILGDIAFQSEISVFEKKKTAHYLAREWSRSHLEIRHHSVGVKNLSLAQQATQDKKEMTERWVS